MIMNQLGSRAFETWDRADESLEITEQRIHDGASTAQELVERGHWYINTFKHLFPYTTPKPGARILDVGSGLGYIMQAANETFVLPRSSA
jgi:2-polyprenyl-3-methyl-5-hydroxy-6-metoxy-1,4-benzoquinol methylase